MKNTKIDLSRRDFCIKLSNTGYVLYYKGVAVTGFGQIAGSTDLKGKASADRRILLAKIADRTVNVLVAGGGSALMVSRIKIINKCI